ncbi:hypothetical protein Q9R32_05170 [Actinotalea sp. AC32]|nr:hypothetical protein [Actinotalea sp. AC32]
MPTERAAPALHSVVVDGLVAVGPDPRKVGVPQMHELAGILHDLGLPVEISTRDHTPRTCTVRQEQEEKPSEGGRPRRGDHDDRLSLTVAPETFQLALEWVGGQAISASMAIAAEHIVRGWVAKRRGRKQSEKATRGRCVAVARWRIGIEFDIDMKTAEPIQEQQEPSGAWTITFETPEFETVTATVPSDVDDLTTPDAVLLGRRVRR